MTGQMLSGVEEILLKERPDYVLVYGDTNSTLAGALAAKKLKIKVIHVEAGLRSFNMDMPEEINRILTDRISDVLCCPTEVAVQNLKREGYDYFPVTYRNTGDVMQDAALYYSDKVDAEKVLSNLLPGCRNFVLCTLHRAENTDNSSRLASIMAALRKISAELPVVMPLHPRTKAKLSSADIDNILCIEPQGYLNMIALLKSCTLVMTDSGGLQKEAYFFGKYCITLRTETEWLELVQAGYNSIAGYEKDNILSAFEKIKTKTWVPDSDLYGGGKASENICRIILECG
jgi:UDP-GlcNAc3NAcA epimerase